MVGLRGRLFGGVFVMLMLMMGVCFAEEDGVVQVSGRVAVNRVYDEALIGKMLDDLVVRDILRQEEGERVEVFLRDKWCLLPVWSREVTVTKMVGEVRIRGDRAEAVVDGVFSR